MAYRPGDYWDGLHRRWRGDVAGVGFAELGAGFNRVAYRRRLSAVRDLLRRTGLPSTSVLEAAVGTGAYAPVWADAAVRRWVGLDISETAIRALRERFPEHAFHALDLTGSDGWDRVGAQRSYDLVTAIDVLYHLVEDAGFARALSTLAGFVRVGGGLIVSDVFVQAVVQRASHVRRRPLSAYEDVLGPLGLERIAREPVFAFLSDPVPRPGLHVRDRVLFESWRVVQKAIRSTPGRLRSAFGAGAARVMLPLDAAARRLGWAEGVGLELAVFRRVL